VVDGSIQYFDLGMQSPVFDIVTPQQRSRATISNPNTRNRLKPHALPDPPTWRVEDTLRLRFPVLFPPWLRQIMCRVKDPDRKPPRLHMDKCIRDVNIEWDVAAAMTAVEMPTNPHFRLVVNSPKSQNHTVSSTFLILGSYILDLPLIPQHLMHTLLVYARRRALENIRDLDLSLLVHRGAALEGVVWQEFLGPSGNFRSDAVCKGIVAAVHLVRVDGDFIRNALRVPALGQTNVVVIEEEEPRPIEGLPG